MTQSNFDMTANELKEILAGKSTDYILVDVRTVAEHEEINIGGLNIPVDKLAESADQLDLSKKIITYCKSGGRSTMACQILQSLGAKEVYTLVGGITNY